jgi:hypothetical protein
MLWSGWSGPWPVSSTPNSSLIFQAGLIRLFAFVPSILASTGLTLSFRRVDFLPLVFMKPAGAIDFELGAVHATVIPPTERAKLACNFRLADAFSFVRLMRF